MAEKLLMELVSGQIQIDDLITWITSENLEDGDFSRYNCTQRDFVSYFLNFLHDETQCANSIDSQEKLFTRVSVKKNERVKAEINRRSGSFPDRCDNENSPQRLYKRYDANSSPKTPRTKSNTHDVVSPVSPLYSRNVLQTPKNKNSGQKSSEKSLCLGDFIVQKKSSKKKPHKIDFEDNNAPSRRINPTNLNQRLSNANFRKSENSFSFHRDFVELPLNDINDQRNILAKECLRIVNKKDELKTIGKVKLQNVGNRLEITPDVDLVSDRSVLDLLVGVYTCILDYNLVVNVTSELHFLITLLVTKRYETTQIKPKSLFESVHNCIYFAVGALKHQLGVLQMLDRSTVKLLIENERIRRFGGDSFDRLLKCDKKSERGTDAAGNLCGNVCFVTETDNRENFPDDASFHAFRKQRDLFYEILTMWERNWFVAGWCFAVALGPKIRTLLNLHNDVVNHRHFARLFKMQLLRTCRGDNSEEGMSETQLSCLSSLPNIDAEKLHRLKSRIVTKQVSDGINSTPSFTGHQEFYKEFIVVSWTHTFYKHLADALIFEILLINDTKFNYNELEEVDTFVDAPTRNSYLESLKSLRILAKFLGFVESLPYKINTNVLPEKILASEVETRKSYQPNFDVKAAILNSIERKTLILTVPWVTKYLSMLDYVTLRLPYYTELLALLINVYCESRRKPQSSNVTLVRLCLGWLFELPHFPSELFYNSSKVTLKNDIDVKQWVNLDELDIVDCKVLYVCCPYLDEFKKVLSSNSTITFVKHITPLTAVESAKETSAKKLKNQLEEEFFNAQPGSVRKTVEFVSERVASACIKYICNVMVPRCKKMCVDELHKMIDGNDDENQEKSHQSSLKDKSHELSVRYFKTLQLLCTEYLAKTSKERIPTSIDLLLSHEELQQVKDTCTTIAMRLCNDRVQQWLSSHVNVNVFTKVVEVEIHKMINHPKEKSNAAFALPPGGKPIKHNPEALSALQIVEKLRGLCLCVLERKSVLLSDVENVLMSTRKSIAERCDFNDSILFVVNKLLLDLLLLLSTTQNVNLEISLKFIEHWKHNANEDLFKNVICPRNVMLLAQSANVTQSWDAFKNIVSLLLRNMLLTCEDFQSQCLKMYTTEWDEVTLMHLSNCFKGVIDDFVTNGIPEDKFTQLVSFCSTLNV